MAPLEPLAYLSALALSLGKETPAAVELEQVRKHFEGQLWHEFSSQLLSLMRREAAVRVAAPDAHDILLVPVRSNLDGATYVKLVYYTCFAIMADANPDGDAAAMDRVNTILDSATASLLSSGNNQCVSAVNCLKALVHLTHGPSLEATRLLDKASDAMAEIPVHEIHPIAQTMYYRAHVRQAELLCDYDDFYVSAFAFLRYGTLAELPLEGEELTAVAYKTSIAALLAKKVYNFGELLTTTEFVKALESADKGHAWALDVVRRCSEGDAVAFDEFIAGHRAVIEEIPDLRDAVASGELGRKVRLMSLLHLIFHTPANERVLSFSRIAEACNVGIRDVEPLLLTALAQHLIEGSIDELEQTAEVTWVLPRVMETKEIAALAKSIGDWRSRVKQTADDVRVTAQALGK